MQSTENLKLNLYEPTDYVLHDHFNSDNRKLDAAVTAARSFHKLKELTAAADVNSILIYGANISHYLSFSPSISRFLTTQFPFL